jgi:hypothetical protein
MVNNGTLAHAFSQYFGFPCHSFIPLIAPQSSTSNIRGWYSRPIMAALIVDFVPLQPQR